MLAQGGIAVHIPIGVTLTYRRNRSLIFLCSVRIPYPSLLLTLATATLLLSSSSSHTLISARHVLLGSHLMTTYGKRQRQ